MATTAQKIIVGYDGSPDSRAAAQSGLDEGPVPEELIFNVDYLGGSMPTFALNFSRPGVEVVAQYYTFFRLNCRLTRPSALA